MSDHISGALGDVHRTARALARRHNLVNDGVLWCWHCNGRKALLPSLACHMCLAEHHRKRGTVGTVIQREQTPADVEACRGSA